MPLRKSPVSYQEFVETGKVRKKDDAVHKTNPDEKKSFAEEQTESEPQKQNATVDPKTEPLTISKKDVRDKRNTVDRKSTVPETLIPVVVPIPAKGVSPTFDLLAETHPEKKALALILRRAMPPYETLLINGKFKSLPKDYPVKPGILKTTRTMPEAAYRVAKKQFDPLDMLPARQFGRIIALAALATFFAEEKQK